MPWSAGNCCFSQPETCFGDHCRASFCATRHSNSRMARKATRLWAQRPLPGTRLSLACAVGAAAAVTPYLSADRRGQSPEALCDVPHRSTGGDLRDISSRSSPLNATRALQRGAGAIPPLRAKIRWTPLLFRLSSARAMSATHWPLLQRSQSSALCFGVNQVRASICIPPHLARLEGVASTIEPTVISERQGLELRCPLCLRKRPFLRRGRTSQASLPQNAQRHHSSLMPVC